MVTFIVDCTPIFCILLSVGWKSQGQRKNTLIYARNVFLSSRWLGRAWHCHINQKQERTLQVHLQWGAMVLKAPEQIVEATPWDSLPCGIMISRGSTTVKSHGWESMQRHTHAAQDQVIDLSSLEPWTCPVSPQISMSVSFWWLSLARYCKWNTLPDTGSSALTRLPFLEPGPLHGAPRGVWLTPYVEGENPLPQTEKLGQGPCGSPSRHRAPGQSCHPMGLREIGGRHSKGWNPWGMWLGAGTCLPMSEGDITDTRFTNKTK